MILRPDKKAVLLRLRDNTKVTDVIPTSNIIDYKGTELVAIKHAPDETKVLRNMGFNVPDPMPTNYNWPGRFTPFDAQKLTGSFASMNDRCYVLNSMGLGKSVTALWAFDYLRKCKQINRVLIVCPMSTMERTWADEVFNNFPDLTCVVLYGSNERRRKLLAKPADIYIINHDGLEIIKKDLAKRADIDLIVLDELAVYRNAGTDRWKITNEVCNKQTVRKVWGLTGQPTPRAPTDAWAQCRIVTPNNPEVPKYFSAFRDKTMRKVSTYKWVSLPNALETVRQCMQPSIRFELDDCIDLPEQTFLHRDVELTPEQKKAYDEMLVKLKAEYDGGQIRAVNELVKASKLIQISMGVAYGTDGEDIILPAKPRLDVVRELIESADGKAIVFVPLTGALERVAEELSSDWKVRVIHGEVSKAERDEIFWKFQNSDEVEVLVANPRTMSHGTTLTAASVTIWYAPIASNDTFGQANGRVRRPGQTRTSVIATIAATPLERRMYQRLQEQGDMQGTLLDMFKGQDLVET